MAEQNRLTLYIGMSTNRGRSLLDMITIKSGQGPNNRKVTGFDYLKCGASLSQSSTCVA